MKRSVFSDYSHNAQMPRNAKPILKFSYIKSKKIFNLPVYFV